MTKKKRRFGMRPVLFLLTIAAVLFLPAASANAEEYSREYDYIIKYYNVDITAHADNTYDIVETIDVHFNYSRCDICQEIPTRYHKKLTPVTNIDTYGETSKVSRSADALTIRLSDADKTITGDKKYTIAYTLNMGADDVKDSDLLYLNIIGTDWYTLIYHTTFNVDISELGAAAQEVSATMGYYGSTDSEDLLVTDHGTYISGAVLRPLVPYEGVTLNVAMPEGTFVGDQNAFEYRKLFTYGIALLTLILLIYGYIKYGSKREPIPVVGFYPPDNLNPAEIGYIIDQSVDSEDIGALIIYWASLGYLKIDEVGSGRFLLTKIRDMGEEREQYEVNTFNYLWECGNGSMVASYEFEDTYFTQTMEIKISVEKKYMHGEKKLYDKKALKFSLFLFLFSMLCLIVMACVGIPLIEAQQGKDTGGFFWLMVMMMAYFALSGAFEIVYLRRNKKTPAAGIVRSVIFTLILFALTMFAIDWYKTVIPLGEVIALLGVPFLVAIVRPSIEQQNTKYGFDIMQRVLGFKQFITYAEESRLEMLINEDSEYVFKMLPYAIALGVSDIWATKFAMLSVQPPRWYAERRAEMFSTESMIHSMARTASDLSSAAVSGPASSGGGDGGSSGGGGGGSW